MLTRYNWNTQGDKLVAFYDSLLRGAPRTLADAPAPLAAHARTTFEQSQPPMPRARQNQ